MQLLSWFFKHVKPVVTITDVRKTCIFIHTNNVFGFINKQMPIVFTVSTAV